VERRVPIEDGPDVAGEVLRLDDGDIVGGGAAGRRHRREISLFSGRDLGAESLGRQRSGRLDCTGTGLGHLAVDLV
jgi:hypothetical protein